MGEFRAVGKVVQCAILCTVALLGATCRRSDGTSTATVALVPATAPPYGRVQVQGVTAGLQLVDGAEFSLGHTSAKLFMGISGMPFFVVPPEVPPGRYAIGIPGIGKQLQLEVVSPLYPGGSIEAAVERLAGAAADIAAATRNVANLVASLDSEPALRSRILLLEESAGGFRGAASNATTAEKEAAALFYAAHHEPIERLLESARGSVRALGSPVTERIWPWSAELVNAGATGAQPVRQALFSSRTTPVQECEMFSAILERASEADDIADVTEALAGAAAIANPALAVAAHLVAELAAAISLWNVVLNSAPLLVVEDSLTSTFSPTTTVDDGGALTHRATVARTAPGKVLGEGAGVVSGAVLSSVAKRNEFLKTLLSDSKRWAVIVNLGGNALKKVVEEIVSSQTQSWYSALIGNGADPSPVAFAEISWSPSSNFSVGLIVDPTPTATDLTTALKTKGMSNGTSAPTTVNIYSPGQIGGNQNCRASTSTVNGDAAAGINGFQMKLGYAVLEGAATITVGQVATFRVHVFDGNGQTVALTSPWESKWTANATELSIVGVAPDWRFVRAERAVSARHIRVEISKSSGAHRTALSQVAAQEKAGFYSGSYLVTECHVPLYGGPINPCGNMLHGNSAYPQGEISFRVGATDAYNVRRNFTRGGTNSYPACDGRTIAIPEMPTTFSFPIDYMGQWLLGGEINQLTNIVFTVTSPRTEKRLSGTFRMDFTYSYFDYDDPNNPGVSKPTPGYLIGTWSAAPSGPFPKCPTASMNPMNSCVGYSAECYAHEVKDDDWLP